MTKNLNLSTTNGFFMTPDAISKCKEKDALRAVKLLETSNSKENKLRMRSV